MDSHDYAAYYFEVILLAGCFDDFEESVADFGGVEDGALAEAGELGRST